MTKKQYGLIAGLAGAALAAWKYFRRWDTREPMPIDKRGDVIYRNDPAMIP